VPKRRDKRGNQTKIKATRAASKPSTASAMSTRRLLSTCTNLRSRRRIKRNRAMFHQLIEKHLDI
jgi:hypothetical protein